MPQKKQLPLNPNRGNRKGAVNLPHPTGRRTGGARVAGVPSQIMYGVAECGGGAMRFAKNYGATACRKDTKQPIKASKCGRLIPCYPVPPCNPRYDYIVKYPSWYPIGSRKREGTWNCRGNP